MVVYTYIYVYIYIYIYIYLSIYIYLCMYVYVYIYIYMCVYMYVYVYICIYTGRTVGGEVAQKTAGLLRDEPSEVALHTHSAELHAALCTHAGPSQAVVSPTHALRGSAAHCRATGRKRPSASTPSTQR